VTEQAPRDAKFLGVPIDLYLEMQAHNDAVGRDLMLALDQGVDSGLEARLRGLLGSGFETLIAAREAMRKQVESARAEGRTHVDISATYAVEDLPTGLQYLDLVEEADDLAAQGTIFVPSPDPAVARLRRWFMRELEDQVLHGHAPHPFVDDRTA
jgi:hypothetical protein